MSVYPQRLFRLKGSIQKYEWGKKDSTSLVARLGKGAISHEFSIDENNFYAEVCSHFCFCLALRRLRIIPCRYG